jgi:5-(carboxyamino)imidazole ribonucleotide synthase
MRIGILGGGQLGRMLALAGYPLGFTFLFREPAPQSPVALLAEQSTGSYEDPAALDRLAQRVDIVTYEFENVPVAAVAHLARRVPVHPTPDALRIMQDRLREKTLCRELGIPVAPFHAVDSPGGLAAAVGDIGLPAMLKTRYSGYDGRGQRRLGAAADLTRAYEDLAGQPLIVEQWVDFDRELSLLAVRGRDGAWAAWPLVENRHAEGILRLSIAPADGVAPALQLEAEGHARRVMERLDYVGVMALEFFEVGGRLLANEMAPRVHNSGHWTIEGAVTSQFENHLRAVAGLPLGDTSPRGLSAMLNIVGTLPDVRRVLGVPGAHLHLYGKDARPLRKLGHVTVTGADPAALAARVAELQRLL